MEITVAHYCGFNITRPLPSCLIFDRFLRKTQSGDLKEATASLVKKLYDLSIVYTSFIGLDSTPIMANTESVKEQYRKMVETAVKVI